MKRERTVEERASRAKLAKRIRRLKKRSPERYREFRHTWNTMRKLKGPRPEPFYGAYSKKLQRPGFDAGLTIFPSKHNRIVDVAWFRRYDAQFSKKDPKVTRRIQRFLPAAGRFADRHGWTLETEATNPALVRLYKKAGFKSSYRDIGPGGYALVRPRKRRSRR